jgi:hypothetical protein
VLAALAITVPLAVLGQPALLPAGEPLSFSNIRISRSADPHADGVRIDLYKHERGWSGFISVYTGPVADPPAGHLEGLQVDERTRTIAFTARLSLGVTMVAREWVPSRDIFEFSGRIDRDALSGVLITRVVGDGATRTTSTEKVVLPREPDSRASPSSYAEWRAMWEARLQARGPRW